MEIDSYQNIAATCRVCLKHLNGESHLVHSDSANWNDLTAISQKLIVDLHGIESNPLLCHHCYTADTARRNGEHYIPYIFSEAIEDNKTELLPYKILSDILKQNHIQNINQEVDHAAAFVDVQQPKSNQDLVKNVALFNPNFLNNYVGGKDASSDYVSGNIKQNGFGGLYDKQNDYFQRNKLSRVDLPSGGHIAQEFMPNINNQQRKSSKLPHKCSTCGFSFTSKSKLTIHTATHRKEELYLSSYNLIDGHNGGIFKCDHCSYKTPFNSELATHSKSHKESKSYKCTECQFRCSSRSYLNVHMRIHTGETPYKCDICGYSTPFKYTLSVHMRTHTGMKPYRCMECDFRCSTKGYLETHTRIHTGETPYKCDICDYNTTFKYTLSVHMRTHLGSKPYQCRECNFKCSSESYLKKHLKTHSGEIYTCSVCPYAAVSRSKVTHHMKQMHK